MYAFYSYMYFLEYIYRNLSITEWMWHKGILDVHSDGLNSEFFFALPVAVWGRDEPILFHKGSEAHIAVIMILTRVDAAIS